MDISMTYNSELVFDREFTFRGFFRKDSKTNEEGTFSKYLKTLGRDELSTINSWIGCVRKNKKLYRTLILFIALINIPVVAFAGTAEAMAGIDKVGAMILAILQKIGYHACIISCIIELLKGFMGTTGSRDIWKILLKYISIFAVLHSLPWLFDLIKEAFA